MSVSISTPQTNLPSLHSNLETVPSSEHSDALNHDINLILQHIDSLDQNRSDENRDLADNVRRIRDELYDLSDFLRHQEPATEEQPVAGPQTPQTPYLRRTGSIPRAPRVPQIPTSAQPQGPRDIVLVDAAPPVPMKDVSVGGSSIMSGLGGPRDMPRTAPHLIPIPLTPPPFDRIPSPTSSFADSQSFLSSHHSDDFSLLGSESYPMPASPQWSSVTPEEEEEEREEEEREEEEEEVEEEEEEVGGDNTSSSPTSAGTYLSETSESSPTRPESSSPTRPPDSSSPTPTSSTTTTTTARPALPSDPLRHLRDLLDELRNQTGALWDGQVSTNHMLDEMRDRRPEDHTELNQRVRNIEDLLQQMIDRPVPQPTLPTPTPQRESRPPQESVYSTSSDETSDLDSLRRRWEELARNRQQIHMPIPVRTGPSLDDQLADLLGAPPVFQPTAVQPPPPLVPFTYHPTSRAARPRSRSPTLDETPVRPWTAPFVVEPVRFNRPPGRRPHRVHVRRPPQSDTDWQSERDGPETPQEPDRRPELPPSQAPTPRPEFRMGDLGQRPQAPGRRPGPMPPAHPVIVSLQIRF